MIHPRSHGLALVLALAACSGETPRNGTAWRVVLAELGGDTELDRKIAALQDQIRSVDDPAGRLEHLGILFVVKARTSYDPGYYKLAEQCADCIEQVDPDNASALLLRGHVLHNLHRFREAEAVARRLVEQRGAFFDHGLLGDVLLDLGQLRDALASYQKMLDLKPCLQSYARAARVRWLYGDLESARELLTLAKGAGSRRDPESLAWTYTQLAQLELQAGDFGAARRACDAALELHPASAAALATRGALDWAEGKPEAALTALRRAAELHPLPEYRWAAADLLRACGRPSEAESVEAELAASGAREDPRSYALYLASRGRDIATALDLTRRELEQRKDVFTFDAHAWAMLAAGDTESAWTHMQEALQHGTKDARLLYHAGAIAAAHGKRAEARGFYDGALARRHALLPSEQSDLRRRSEAL